jgi:hypothetical protein
LELININWRPTGAPHSIHSTPKTPLEVHISAVLTYIFYP